MIKIKKIQSMLCLISICIIVASGSGRTVYAEEPDQNSGFIEIKGALQSEPVSPYVFEADLRDLPKIEEWKPGDPIIERPRRLYPRPEEVTPQPSGQRLDPLLEIQENISATLTSRISTPELNFDGQSYTGAFPPDTVGEVGLNNYIQMVNHPLGSLFTVYDKNSGSIVAGPAVLSSLWTIGGPCASGRGDPIVLFDTLAGRWLLSEFAAIGNHLCVYISRTSDPVSGGWYLYDFNTPIFPDYPKYAVWPDAYYVSTNEFSPAAYALDRTQMLNGLPATFQRFTAPRLPAFAFQSLLPGDLDGPTLPPAGSPNYFIRHRDGEVNFDPPDPFNDVLEIWEFSVDWNNPANSTFTGPFIVQVSDFDSDLCGLISLSCFPQPGTSTRLDPLREVVMWRLQYRNFGTYETLAGNFVTDVDGTDRGGIRWFELRNTGGGWTLFQEGTYAPDQAHRWMGSIAMDKDGNMALGYSVTSSTVFPSIRYAGRLSSDPPGTMPQGEFTLFNGAGSQTLTSRWGDYSSMNIDPVDDCTFWYTNEYTAANGQWRTRIGSFNFSTCQEPLPPKSYDIWLSPSFTSPPYDPIHDCLRVNSTGTQVTIDALGTSSAAIVETGQVGVWIALIPVSGVDDYFFYGTFLSLGENDVISGSGIAIANGWTFGAGGQENANCFLNQNNAGSPYVPFSDPQSP